MPGPAIAQHLGNCTEASFNRVAQIFRHDVVLYAGMLQSWVCLFESELVDAPPLFAHMTRQLRRMSEQFLEEAQPRLHPQYVPVAAAGGCQKHIGACWDQFHAEFAAYARPRLIRLESYLRTYLTHPEFGRIQASLNDAAGDEQIDRLLWNTYHKLAGLMDAEKFDRRVAEMLDSEKPACAGSA